MTVFLAGAAVGVLVGVLVGVRLARRAARREIRQFVRLMAWSELIELARCTVIPNSFTAASLSDAVVDEIVDRESERGA